MIDLDNFKRQIQSRSSKIIKKRKVKVIQNSSTKDFDFNKQNNTKKRKLNIIQNSF